MSFQRFKALIELIKRYRNFNDTDYYTVIFCDLESLTELRDKCARSLFELREDNQEYFYGSRILFDYNNSNYSNYLGVAFEDKKTKEISHITEISEGGNYYVGK